MTTEAESVKRAGTRLTWISRGKLTRQVWRGFLVLLIAVISFIFIVPLLWMISSSLKPEAQVFEYPVRLIPRQFVWSNYPNAAKQFPFVQSIFNTMVIMAGVMFGRLVTASAVAFSFARLRFPGRNALFLLVLSAMMVPYHAVLIPQYLLFRNLGWLNDWKPLFVPSLFGIDAFFIFLLRQFFMTIPKNYDDAARIDGASTWDIFWRIIMPMSLPALGTVAIFTFMGVWNDFLAPLIYLDTPVKQTVAIAFQQWQRTSEHLGYKHPWNYIMAVATLVTLPPILLFFVAQRYFIQGVVISGVKG